MNKTTILVFALLCASSSTIAEGLTRYQMDLDHDGRLETVIAEELYGDEPNFKIPLETKISVLESNGSLAAESRVSNGQPQIEFLRLGGNGRQQFAVWTSGGMHYTNLSIFDYSKGKIAEIFSNGSACEVKANFRASQPTIRIGRADRSDPTWNYASGKQLWNVYSWNGEKFAFDAKKSTTKEIAEDEEVAGYADAVMKPASSAK